MSSFKEWLRGPASDFLVRKLEPWLSISVVLSGVIVSYDFSEFRKSQPKWLGLFDFLESQFFFVAFVIFAILSAVIAWRTRALQKSMAELKNDAIEARDQLGELGNNIKYLFDGLLLNLSKKIDFKQGDNARISLYVHEAQNGIFVPCGRYSPNPELRKPGRTSCPDGQGCIAKGWQAGWHYDDTLPESASQHRNHCNAHYSIPKMVHDNLKMHSTVYAVKRIDDSNGSPLAVIVVESLKNDQFDANELQSNLESMVADFAQMIGTLRQHIPSPTNASERGL